MKYWEKYLWIVRSSMRITQVVVWEMLQCQLLVRFFVLSFSGESSEFQDVVESPRRGRGVALMPTGERGRFLDAKCNTRNTFLGSNLD